MRAPFVAIILIVQSAVALFDIAQNVCDIGDKQLKCYMRTLQSDINQADVEAVSEAESLTVKCSDAFFYESTLRANHFGALPNLENLEVEYCKIRHMPARAFVGLSGLQRLAVKSHNSEWSSILMDVDRDTFVDLKNVRSLDLSHNNMWSLPLDSLCHMPKLTHLNMSRNHLLDVTDLGLNQLDGKCTVSLKELDVSRNFISSLRSNDLSQTSQSIERLSLRRNRLTFISDEALWSMSRLQVLDLADNQLAALPPAVFNKSGQLQELHLQNNSLTLVTPELFSGLSNLVLLNLSHNAISSHLLASDTFGGLVSLRVLDLSHNRLTKLDATIFNTLPKLEILILDHNRIHNIDSSLAGLTQLRSISLANNKIAIINEYSFAGLTNLTSINLSGNELTELATFGDSVMGSLEELSLSGNQLTTFPRAMLAQADSLKTLDLGENRIESIPDGVFANLQNLYALRLAGNDIALLSNATFGNMSGLHVLNMANNRLETIPQGTFGGLQQLRGLRLDNNALVDLNGIVASLGLLQWLNVSANGLEWFDYAFIPNSLEWLDISHNEISELGNFYRLQNFNLHTLEAGHNLISSIDESSVPARQLQYIQLRHNSIAKVATHTFAELAYLDTVDLRSNQIRSLAKESLRKSIQVRGQTRPQVLLHANPLECDCHLEWLPSINDDGHDDDDDDHVRVADLAELECQLNGASDQDHEHKEVVLVSQVPEGGFLCSYTTHCFDLCRCCDFYACDCRMQCPTGCTCQHDATWSQNTITCSNGNQTNIPLLIPMDATQLFLDGNNFGHIGQQHFLGRQRVHQLYLNNSGVKSIGDNAFTGLTGLRTLDLNNSPLLRELKGFEFTGLAGLRELRLDHSGLVYINDVTFQPLESLQVLRLDNNLLTSFPVWRLASQNRALDSVSLAQNVWSCECEFIAPFNDYLESHIESIADYEEVQCVSENAVAFSRNLCKTTASLAKVSGAEEDVVADNNLSLAVILVPALLSISVLVVGLLAIFVFKGHIKTWLYAKSSEVYESRYNSSIGSSAMGGGGVSEAKLFDLYVSYAKEDAEFVDHNLAPTLEHGPRATYRLCVHHRDFPQDLSHASVYDTVAVATESSAKILIVLSKAYLAKEWPTVKPAILDSLRRSTAASNKLVILCIDDVSEADLRSSELLTYFINGPTVKWGSAGFINKLRFFLPEPVHTTFRRTVTLRTIQQSSLYGGPPQSEHLYHYIPESHVYHTLEPMKLVAANSTKQFNYGGGPITNPTFVFKVDQPQLQRQPLENGPSAAMMAQLAACHSHSLSTSSGQRLLTSPTEEYIV